MKTIDKYELGYNETLKKDIQEANKKVNDITKLSKSLLNFFNNKKDIHETYIIKQSGEKNETK